MFPMLRAGFALLFGLGMLLRIQAQPLAEAAPAMARSIFSLLPRRATASLEFQALAPAAPVEWSSFRSALRDELRKSGVDLKDTGQSESRVRIVVSENPRGLLLVAEVVGNDTRQVVMVPWGRLNAVGARPGLRIQMTPITELTEPILDVWMSDSGLDLLVLTPSKVIAMHLTDGKWSLNGQASLPVSRPIPRDPRGRLEALSGSLGVYLPATTCTGQVGPRPIFSCEAVISRWSLSTFEPIQVRWVTDRNVLETDSVGGSFYTAAMGWFASASGKVLNREGEVPGTHNWGSDLAAIANPCGSAESKIVIVAGAGESNQQDQVQAFSPPPEPPAAVSAPVPLPGAVTALWSAERTAQATLVIRNSTTGNYEASRLSLACTQ
jgi:hypothetical protein